jgi:hypothetical protein
MILQFVIIYPQGDDTDEVLMLEFELQRNLDS